ncbi:MAG: hypothetical protein O7G84_02635, partial [Gammaproteobacteria bacterium]|nr:hypothetical protein [Gammaproteobacteria bacterium]
RRGKATGKKQGVVEVRASIPASWLSDHVEDYGTATPATAHPGTAPPQSSPPSSPQRSVGLLEKVIGWLLRP